MQASLMSVRRTDSYLFRNLILLNPRFSEVREGYEVLVEDSHFKAVSDRPIHSATAHVIDTSLCTHTPRKRSPWL